MSTAGPKDRNGDDILPGDRVAIAACQWHPYGLAEEEIIVRCVTAVGATAFLVTPCDGHCEVQYGGKHVLKLR